MKKIARLSVLSLSAVIMLVSFQNCGPVPLIGHDNPSSTQSTPTTTSSGTTHTLPEQNYLKEAAPALICGEAGYSYMMRNYFVKNCGACHDNTGVAQPHFANALDVSGSYGAARSILKTTFITTTTENRFCGSECSLSTQGQTYKALVEWLDNKTCP